MIDTIRKTLGLLNIETWKIREQTVDATELFFIRKNLDMNRSKQVKNCAVTVYRDFTENGEQFRGSASVKLGPDMTDSEVREKLEKAYYAASFVRNPWYPLPGPSGGSPETVVSRFESGEIMPYMTGLADSLYRNDTHSSGGINSAELFISRYRYRLVTSEGIDVRYNRCQGDIELVTDWKEKGESVELYDMYSFSDYCPEMIEEECGRQIENCRLRARALPAQELKSVNIILGPEAVYEIMQFYVSHGSAKGVYEGVSRAEKGKVFQGVDVTGDRLSITLDPALPNSPLSVPYDEDGVLLKKTELYRDGTLLDYHGSVQYSHYLNIEPTGIIRNIEVKEGKGEFETLKKEPHVEILSFSDFQMDVLTGDFGGEIRLALYFDGKTATPITGASLSACLFDVHNRMYLSQEKIRKYGYSGPKHLLFPEGHLAGSGN